LALNYADGSTVSINGEKVSGQIYNIPALPSYASLSIEVTSEGKTAVYTLQLDVPLSSSNISYDPEVAANVMEVRGSYDSYQWYEDDVLLPNATSEVLFVQGGLKVGAVYSVTAYSGYDSVRICGETALPMLSSDKKELVAAPNPATTHITVSHPDLGRETTVVGIYSSGSGSLVQSYTVEAGNGNAVQIDISGLASGTYVIRVLGTTKMIVKQ
jgi:hypothetical protein